MAEQPERVELIRHEDELAIGTEIATVGRIRAEKRVEVEHVAQDVPRTVEHAEVERLPAEEGDNGQIETLPDGSISIPVLEEELVVTKRTVVRERIVIRKELATEYERVEAELRREGVELEEERSGEQELPQ
jgi:uncharacterized protein (TIGR02271 family)